VNRLGRSYAGSQTLVKGGNSSRSSLAEEFKLHDL
jgi:hypothetical protein